MKRQAGMLLDDYLRGAAGGSSGTKRIRADCRAARHARLQHAWLSSPANLDTVSRLAAEPIGVTYWFDGPGRWSGASA